jgi:hypothetical protein
MALGSTQPLTETSTTILLGVKGGWLTRKSRLVALIQKRRKALDPGILMRTDFKKRSRIPRIPYYAEIVEGRCKRIIIR